MTKMEGVSSRDAMNGAYSYLSGDFGAAGHSEAFLNIPCISVSGNYQRWDADPALWYSGRLSDERECIQEVNREEASGASGLIVSGWL